MQKRGVAAETAWGKWVRKQPVGVLTRAMRQTGLAYTTVHRARKKRMTRDVAELLSKFSNGEVAVKDIVRKRKPLV